MNVPIGTCAHGVGLGDRCELCSRISQAAIDREDIVNCAEDGCEECIAELEDPDHSHDDDWSWND